MFTETPSWMPWKPLLTGMWSQVKEIQRLLLLLKLQSWYFWDPECPKTIHLAKHFSYAFTLFQPREITVLVFQIFFEMCVYENPSSTLASFWFSDCPWELPRGLLGNIFRAHKALPEESGKMQQWPYKPVRRAGGEQGDVRNVQDSHLLTISIHGALLGTL